MSYQVNKFEVDFKGKTIAVAIHVVTEEDETNYILSIEDHENFEIRRNKENQWKAESNSGISDSLLALITEKYESSKS